MADQKMHFLCYTVRPSNNLFLSVMTNRFKATDGQYSNDVVMPLQNPTSDTRLLVHAANFGLENIYRTGLAYKKAGVILQGISSAAVHQQSLFTTFGDGAKSNAMMNALDKLNMRSWNIEHRCRED